MADNFQKAEALSLVAGASSASGQYKFADEQKEAVVQILKPLEYANAYGNKLPVKSITKGSVTYTLNAGEMISQDKSGIGTGGITAETTGFKPKTVYLSKPKKIEGGFEEADLMQTEIDAVAIKFTQAINSFDKEFQKGFMKTVAKAKAGTGINIAAIKTADQAKEVKTLIVDAMTDMSEIHNAEYALDGIDEDEIFADLSSKLFNRLVDERLIVDAADAVFADGIFRIGKMGGFTVRRNQYLGKTGVVDSATKIAHAVIATGYTAVSPKAIVAANAGQVGDLSNDQGYYVEERFASTDGTAVDYGVIGIEPLLEVFVDDSGATVPTTTP